MAQIPTFDGLPDAVARLEVRIDEISEFLKSKLVTNPDTPKYLDRKNAVKYLNECGYKMSTSTLYKLTGRNAIPHRKASGALIFSKTELDNWIKNNLNISNYE